MCGGSIVRDCTVLTAAHCVVGDSDPSRYTVAMGSSHLATAQRMGVAGIEVHGVCKQFNFIIYN